MKYKCIQDQMSLQPGDIVDIVAPASKGHLEVLDQFKEILSTWGLKSRAPVDLFGDSLLYANSDEKRFEHLKNALLNETSKAVWCLLGGYGSSKLIPMLATITPPKHSKIFIGFSDITAIHIFLQNRWGWSTLHGPSGYQVSLKKVSAESIKLLKNMLLNKDKSLIYHEIVPLNSLAENKAVINASIIGGNLHLIQTTLGTSWQMNADNKIVFIEEVSERAYRVDRALAHLSQAGVFEHAKAILFGDFIDKGEPDGQFLVQETLKEFASQTPLPVLQIKGIGHGLVNNPIWLGSVAQLRMGDHYSLNTIFNSAPLSSL